MPSALPAAPALWRSVVVVGCVVVALGAIGRVFWQQDLRYSLPTPRPADLVAPPVGGPLPLPAEVIAAAHLVPGKPVLLNFYNHDCPCSRFNREHLQFLLNRFGAQVQFVGIVETELDDAIETGLAMPHVVDHDAHIAKALGVYATPQAVLIDAHGRLLFRGNYNTSRYCTAAQTQFARLAIEAMLNDTGVVREPQADIAYGCSLPGEECRDDR